MNVIETDSGHRFVVDVVRSFIGSRKGDNINVMRNWERNHPYMCIYPLQSGVQLVAAENDAADHYLLAECLLNHASADSDNLVYAEKYKDNKYLLIIREGATIAIDTLRTELQLRDMLNSIPKDYLCYSHNGDDILDRANLTYEKVDSWLGLAQPVAQYRLVPSKEAIRPYVKSRNLYAISGLAASILVAYLFIFDSDDSMPVMPILYDPYKAMKEAMAQPTVESHLTLLQSLIARSIGLIAWQNTKLSIKNNEIQLHFIPTLSNPNHPPPTDELFTLKTALGGTLSFNQQSATISLPLELVPRTRIRHIYPCNSRLDYIVRSLSSSAIIGAVKNINHGQFSEIKTKIILSGISYDRLSYFAKVFVDEPVVLHEVTIDRQNPLMINASLNLSIYGSES